MTNLLFQYCQKIIVFKNNDTEVLLCKRKWEEDYNWIYSFIGGKMETTDENIIKWLKREKDEEVGPNVKLDILIDYNSPVLFRKKDGNSMILPHYYAKYNWWEILLNEEYNDYKRIKLSELDTFEPKIYTIPEMVNKILKLKKKLWNTANYVNI